MRTTYTRDLRAHLTIDDRNRVRHIRHGQQFWESEHNIPRDVTAAYLRAMAETLRIPASQLLHLEKRVSFLDPRDQGIEYQLSGEKRFFDSVTVGYYQTYLNTPVWRRGLSVTIKENPNRVVGSVDNSEEDLAGKLPPTRVIERYRQLFRTLAAQRMLAPEGLADEAPKVTAAAVSRVLKLPVARVAAPKPRLGREPGPFPRVLNGRFFIYKFDPDRRYAGLPRPSDRPVPTLETGNPPFPRLPAVPDRVRTGQAYLVGEILYEQLTTAGRVVWLVLVELETGAILYIEPQTFGVNGLVFARDPIVSTGNLTITADQANTVLNPEQDDVLLNNLDAPVAGVQNLSGTYVNISNQENPNIAPPTTMGG